MPTVLKEAEAIANTAGAATDALAKAG